MKKIFCISSINSVGCTFFDWSIHFLSGKTQYYSADSKQWIPLATVNQLLTPMNAHGHKKNHPHGRDESLSFIKQVQKENSQGLYSFYPTFLHIDNVAKKLNLDCKDLSQPNTWQPLQQYRNTDYENIFLDCHSNNVKVIYISCDVDPFTSLYFLEPRHLEGLRTHRPAAGTEEMEKEFQELFFNQSIKQWKELNLTQIWDIRERMALDIRPFNSQEYKISSLVNEHLWISCLDLWYCGHDVITKIMQYINIPIDKSRFKQWKIAYESWQKMQLNRLKFSYSVNHIVDSIVNNWYYDIGSLTFKQEVVIQHLLIYKHNLNLKTWQLEKFPTNTKDLHLLLEPNIHPISKIY